MKKNKVTQKDVFFLSISMFVIVVAWIGFNLYHAWATSTISQDLQIQIIPIAPKFDTQTLDKLKTREKIEPLFGAIAEVTASPTAAIITPIIPEISISPTPDIAIPTEEPLPTEELVPTEEQSLAP